MDRVKNFAAGGLGGACEILTTMPLDTIKTQMQLYPTKFRNPISAIYIISTSPDSSFVQLYKGLGPMLIQVSLKAAIRFTSFEYYRNLLHYLEIPHLTSNSSIHFISGLMSGFTESILWTTPTERLKVLQQSEVGISSNSMKYKTMTGSFRSIFKEEGIRGIYRGTVATCLRQGSSVAMRFFFYHNIKEMFIKYNNRKNPSAKTITPFQSMLAGGFCGGFSVFINNPIDVVKSRIQASRSQSSPGSNGFIKVFLNVYKNDGLYAFYRGVSARIVRVGIGQGITFMVYEQIMRLLNYLLPSSKPLSST